MKKGQKKPIGNIEDETPIMPWIVADGAIEDAQSYLPRNVEIPNSREMAEELSDYANKIYKHNDRFRKQIRAKGNRGRDTLYMFMRHWLASFLHEKHPAIFEQLPHGYGWNV